MALQQCLSCRSLYLNPPRPENPRLRSNSLPSFALTGVSEEEAGIIFSAGERAAARRRRHAVSVDSPQWSELDSIQFPRSTTSSCTIKPSSLRQGWLNDTDSDTEIDTDTVGLQDLSTLNNSQSLDDEISEIVTEQEESTGRRPPSSLPDSQSLFKSPLSSPRRKVPSPIKDYSDSVFLFTQSRLDSAIPSLPNTYPTLIPSIQIDEEPDQPLASPPRPQLISRFSDWSAPTESNRSSMVIESRRVSVDEIILEPEGSLMSPDSFFDSNTPRMVNSNFNISRASSGTFDSTYDLPPSAASSSRATDGSIHDEEFSYFANFDKYVERDSRPKRDPTDVVIDMSPSEFIQSTRTPPRMKRRKTDPNFGLEPVIANGSYEPSPSMQTIPGESNMSFEGIPSIHVADVAVRVPSWLIGAIG